MVYCLDAASCRNFDVSSSREWLLANGHGGYATGTVSGANTRRYHGHLVAATTPPTGRMVLLANIDAFVQAEGGPIGISTNQYPGALNPEGYLYLESFKAGRSVEWVWRLPGGLGVRKTLSLVGTATTVRYTNIGEKAILLTLRPLVSHRPHHGDFDARPEYPSDVGFPKNATIVTEGGIRLHLSHPGAQRIPVQGWYYRFEHQREQERGLRARDDLYCPCELKWELLPGEEAVLVASLGKTAKPLIEVEDPDDHRLRPALEDACAKFLVRSERRACLMAGYPWFADWGRDTMIALPGACLVPGRFADARAILRDYAGQRDQGLIPNRFVEEGGAPEYNTVDATLWFANAVYKTLLADWDDAFAAEMGETLADVFRWHMGGTHYGISVDPSDGLLRQGAPGVQLTWMDAKVGDWVVTPRHGKPVEVNGLWINALRVMEWLANRTGNDALAYLEAAELAESNFERKFWKESIGHYLDTADPDDASLRPNQVIAMALPFGPAKGANALRALRVVERELLTPYGLRTLGPRETGYRGRYEGPMSERDAAYHQGTVWPWLLGPYATALVRLANDKPEARRVLRAAREMLSEQGLGGIAEVYDGDSPHRPSGCPWQAWSAAEILRAWVEDAGGD